MEGISDQLKLLSSIRTTKNNHVNIPENDVIQRGIFKDSRRLMTSFSMTAE